MAESSKSKETRPTRWKLDFVRPASPSKLEMEAQRRRRMAEFQKRQQTPTSSQPTATTATTSRQPATDLHTRSPEINSSAETTIFGLELSAQRTQTTEMTSDLQVRHILGSGSRFLQRSQLQLGPNLDRSNIPGTEILWCYST